MGMRQDSPYEWSEEIKILGIIFDARMCFQIHINKMLSKAKIRQCLMSKLARCSWGIETGVPRVSQEALLASLSRYGLAVVGSGAYEKDLCFMEARHANIAARRILGVGRSARIGTMMAIAGTQSVHNLYIKSCAAMLDRCLRAINSSIGERMSRWSGEQFGVPDWHHRDDEGDTGDFMK